MDRYDHGLAALACVHLPRPLHHDPPAVEIHVPALHRGDLSLSAGSVEGKGDERVQVGRLLGSLLELPHRQRRHFLFRLLAERPPLARSLLAGLKLGASLFLAGRLKSDVVALAIDGEAGEQTRLASRSVRAVTLDLLRSALASRF